MLRLLGLGRAQRAVLLRNRQGWSRSSASTAERPEYAERTNRSTVVALGIPVVLSTCLGFWQVMRLEDKKKKIDVRRMVLTGTAVTDLDAIDTKDEYKRIHVRGTFLPDKIFLFGPRSAPKSLPDELTPSYGQVGYFLLAPLKLDDGRVVLVNRGWVPHKMKEYQSFDATPEGRTEVEGIVCFSDKQNRFTPVNDPQHNQWYSIDVPAVLEKLNSEGPAFFVDTVNPGRATDDVSLPWARTVEDHINFYTDPFTHKIYATTWFALALMMSWLIYARLYGRARWISKSMDRTRRVNSSPRG
eukprot:Plantae.Rhodophyta-Purpureofilum_apyrenoidigerum.ctg1206.p1 GENE.Plantae.Rhodophyta-Purpureofilum_apyrenoidigerum.ctg1206~~Plantae.Rhodophyta-Purpureofilum_apyrenoidigerum.ctg1206.p1  ORF type:complete len:300 (-),score=40.91 Plantae.Rhodophyta-Purpureofilum_apyrenoidigerum.ctg1206:174-1073(-)